MARFSAIPAVPPGSADEWTQRILSALKENVELLTGTRGEADLASKALVRGDVSLVALPTPAFRSLTARGNGAQFEGVQVPLLADYVNLLQDVQNLAYDVALLRTAVDALTAQLRG